MILAAHIGVAQDEKQTTVAFDQTTINYGKIKAGEDGVRIFTFTNTGEHDLIIARVYTGCSCTASKIPENAIKPGEKGEIEITYDTRKIGPIAKVISVYANVPDGIVPLRIKGQVLPAE